MDKRSVSTWQKQDVAEGLLSSILLHMHIKHITLFYVRLSVSEWPWPNLDKRLLIWQKNRGEAQNNKTLLINIHPWFDRSTSDLIRFSVWTQLFVYGHKRQPACCKTESCCLLLLNIFIPNRANSFFFFLPRELRSLGPKMSPACFSLTLTTKYKS